jgi:hypothetical protein
VDGRSSGRVPRRGAEHGDQLPITRADACTGPLLRPDPGVACRHDPDVARGPSEPEPADATRPVDEFGEQWGILTFALVRGRLLRFSETIRPDTHGRNKRQDHKLVTCGNTARYVVIPRSAAPSATVRIHRTGPEWPEEGCRDKITAS